MRATIHLVTARDWARLRPVIGSVLARNFRGSPFSKALAGIDLDELLSRGRDLLAEMPRSRAELSPLLAVHWPGADPASLAHAVSYLEPIIQVPPRGLWRSAGQARWTTAAAWLDQDVDPESAVDDLMARYLAALRSCQRERHPSLVGPDQTQPGCRASAGPAAEDEQGRELLDVLYGPLPDPDVPAPPRFLPPFDNAILSHADRNRIIAHDHRPVVNQDRLLRTFLDNMD